MSNRSIGLDDGLHQYLLSVSLREPDVLRQLREETAALPQANMQIAPEQGQFMGLLVRLTGARHILEIGVFTGYSSIALALDISEEWTAIARRYWALAGVAGQIDLRLEPASRSLDRLLADGRAGGFDLAFIDADKESYDAYYEKALSLLRPGGLLLIDNVLWNGAVADLNIIDKDTCAIRALNQKIHADARVDIALLPVADGLSLVRKK